MDELDQRWVQAIADGDLAGLQKLLENLEPAEFDASSMHLLSHAVLCDDLAIVQWLLRRGADPNLADPYGEGRPVLYWAVLQKSSQLIPLLVKHGARVVGDRLPEDGDTALHLAVEQGDQNLTSYLIEEAGGTSALGMFDEFDHTPLHKAVGAGSDEVVRILLDAGADVNALVHVKHHGRVGDTPLKDAVYDGHFAIARLLFERGADPDRPGWMWNSARDSLSQCPGEVRPAFEALFALEPLNSLADSEILTDIDEELTADLVALGLKDISLDWSESRRSGETEQVRGHRIAPYSNIRLLDSNGDEIGRGDFNFVVLTVEIEFRAFWTRLDTPKRKLRSSGQIPQRVWRGLTVEQQSWIIMDSRNAQWRAKEGGKLQVEPQT